MKKNQKTLWKTITHISALVAMGIALILGIVFSSLKITTLGYGPSFAGGYQATVQVVRNNDNNKATKEDIAKGLESKLSPFGNIPLTVSYVGEDHVAVNVGKDAFTRSSLINAIQSTGGLFVFTKDNNVFNDLYTNSDAISAISGDTRINSEELFTADLNVASLAKSQGRAPYLHLGLTESDNTYNFAKITSALDKKDPQSPPQYYFITDLEVLINDILSIGFNSNGDDKTIEFFWDNVIKPAQDYLSGVKEPAERETLRDVFSANATWLVGGTGTNFWRKDKISLLDTTFENGLRIGSVTGIRNVNDLKYLFKPQINPIDNTEYTILSANSDRPLDYFLYKPDTTKADLEGDLYKEDRVSDLSSNPNLGSIQNTFKIVTNFFLNKLILTKDNEGKEIYNEALIKNDPTIKEHFIFNGGIYNNEDGAVTIPRLTEVPGLGFVTIDIQNGVSNQLSSGLYVPTASLTVGQKAVSSINQSALGISYRVETVIDVAPTISWNWLLISIIFLAIIVLLLIIYVLFAYRLLGLFTLIIAITTASLMLVFATLFGFTIGPQLIMALFLVIGLTIDLGLILFNAFAKRIYQDKQAIKTAFKIANKETIALSIDAIVVALIPNIVMFWVGQGDLKNFATMATIGIFLTLILGILILRTASWLILKFKSVQTNNFLLPIDTNFNWKLSLKDQYLIHKYNAYLEKHEGKDQYSSKELLKIKQTTEKLANLTQDMEKQKLVNLNKLKLKDQQEAEKVQKQIAKLEKRQQMWSVKHLTFLGIDQKIKTHYDFKIEELKDILKSEVYVNVSEANQESMTKKLRVLKTERNFNRIGSIIAIVILMFSVLATIIGVSVGPNWGSEFGKGQQFVIYGQEIRNSYDNVLGSGRPYDWKGTVQGEEADRIVNDKKNKDAFDVAQDALNKALATGVEATIQNAEKNLYKVEAEQLQQFYTFIINNNYFENINQNARKIHLANWNIQINDDYNFVNPETGQVTNSEANKIALTINSTATDKLSRTNFRRMLAYLANPLSSPWINDNSDHRSETGGIIAYDLAPFTTYKLVQQILIVFGILLLALIIYIVIRFKWTYYVALALGLILTFAATVAAVILLRIPVSVELLSGFALLISFVLITMILVLGKGKTLLTQDDKVELMKKFGPELEQVVKVRQKKAELDKKTDPMKAELKQLGKDLHKLTKNQRKNGHNNETKISELKVRQAELKQKLKTQIHANQEEFKAFKKESGTEIRFLSKRNFFFKEIYLELIRFTLKRVATIGLFYILTALVLLITLAPMFGMGLIVLIGIVIGFVVTLFVVIPLWIVLERYRLRNANGFKIFMNNIEVSQEEQIVFDVND